MKIFLIGIVLFALALMGWAYVGLPRTTPLVVNIATTSSPRPLSIASSSPLEENRKLNQLVVLPVSVPVTSTSNYFEEKNEIYRKKLMEAWRDSVPACYRIQMDLERGMSDHHKKVPAFNQVSELNFFLSDLGFEEVESDPDYSTFTDKTELALKKFQDLAGLPVTGVLDKINRDVIYDISCGIQPGVVYMPYLRLVWPSPSDSNDKIIKGRVHMINWVSGGYPDKPGKINIGLFKENGRVPVSWIATGLDDTGAFWWKPDSSLPNRSDYAIGISGATLPNGSVASGLTITDQP